MFFRTLFETVILYIYIYFFSKIGDIRYCSKERIGNIIRKQPITTRWVVKLATELEESIEEADLIHIPCFKFYIEIIELNWII